jgi:hypothetical protein
LASLTAEAAVPCGTAVIFRINYHLRSFRDARRKCRLFPAFICGQTHGGSCAVAKLNKIFCYQCPPPERWRVLDHIHFCCTSMLQSWTKIAYQVAFTHDLGRRSVLFRKKKCSPAGCWRFNFALTKF